MRKGKQHKLVFTPPLVGSDRMLELAGGGIFCLHRILTIIQMVIFLKTH